MPPIGFRLRMNVGIAIDFTCRRLKNSALQALGEAEHVDGTMHAYLGCRHRVQLIMDRRSRTGEIENCVNFDVQRHGHIMAHGLE